MRSGVTWVLPMDPTLQQLQSELARGLKGLDAAKTQLRPPSRQPDKWNIQQIIEHLLLTYAGTERALEARIDKRTPTRTKPNLTQSFSQYTVLRLGYFPAGRKAPPLVTPAASAQPLSGEELSQSVSEHLSRLDQRCVEAGKLFGETERSVTHMILGPLSIQQWRKFQLVHGEHHLKQIVAIRKAHRI